MPRNALLVILVAGLLAGPLAGCSKKKDGTAKSKTPCAIVTDRLIECDDDPKIKAASQAKRDERVASCEKLDKAKAAAKRCQDTTDCRQILTCLTGG